jgi:hypothetical protein
VTAEVIQLRPRVEHAALLGRCRSLWTRASPTLPALLQRPGVDRRRRPRAGFNVAAALEPQLDRYRTKGELMMLIARWLRATECEGLVTHSPEYVCALRRAMRIFQHSGTVEEAMRRLQVP